MVNGNYVLYGDRPSSESEIVDDHVQTRTAERKEKRKCQRSGTELHGSSNAPLDNETDSIKYEKKIKEPRLLRYIPTTEVEENFVTDKFETYHMKPSEERPRRYAFTKKPKNPTDGSVNYAYSRSNSNSPNGNLPTIEEHGEQYGTYRVRGMPLTKEDDLSLPPYESKLDKYFVKPRESKKFRHKISYNGSHPDSLYRVPNSSGAEDSKVGRALRTLRWPAALLVVCAALAVFVYFLMPENIEPGIEVLNSTYWESPGVNKLPQAAENTAKSPTRKIFNATSNLDKSGTSKKPVEIDFYDADTAKNYDLISVIDSAVGDKSTKAIPVPPVFPSHLQPEVQYGNEEADKDKQRSSKIFDDKNKLSEESTVKPHITQRPEKPLAIYFKDATSVNPETINRAETVNDFSPYAKSKPVEQPKRIIEQIKLYPDSIKRYADQPKRLPIQQKVKENSPYISPEVQEFFSQQANAKFTSGHSNFFGVGIEDIDKMQSTTQSSVYNTRVSPTLPTWRDGDDSTTKNYPVNLNTDVPQCHSPHLSLCRGVLPYDLAGPAPSVGGAGAGADIAAFLTELEYVVSTNCSERARLFVCSLLEPECNPPPFPPKKPCYSLCRAVMDACDSYIPQNVAPAFNCKQYENVNCLGARAPCYPREMACGDGTCIPRDWVCDGTKDCPAGEDEKQCLTCDKNQYQCPAGGCVQKRWLCDGYLDCPEGSDEREEICAQFGVSPAPPAAEVAGDEPGEEGAGSAPAPAVRRLNTLPGREARRRTGSRTAVEDSSKELLITSDTSNALMRNFTRIPSRLTPYRPRVPLPVSREDTSNESSGKAKSQKTELPRTLSKTTAKPTVKTQKPKESVEDFVPLGLLDEFEKESDVKKDSEPNKAPSMREFQPEKVTPIRPMNNTNNKIDRFIDGAALLRKAELEEARERAQAKSLEMEYEEKVSSRTAGAAGAAGAAGVAGGRSSPCPAGELRCVDGLCITLAQLCDGVIDCTDHADEDNCFT